jgi:hypothetical protein
MQFQKLSIISWTLTAITATNMASIQAAFTTGGIPSSTQIRAKGSRVVDPLPFAFHGYQTIKFNSGSISRLFAENSGEAESTQEDSTAEASSAPQEDDGDDKKKTTKENGVVNDILNSPAFLKRKIDVLKSDIEAANEKIEAANKVYEANKAEWGPQLEMLRKEVSSE